MQPISRDYAYPSLQAPPLSSTNERGSAALRVGYGTGGKIAELVWTLPYAVAVGRLAQVNVTLKTSVGEVPVVLRVLDGPRLELRFGSHHIPGTFDAFRVTVRSDAFAEVEMGGSSSAEGFAFSTSPSLDEDLLSSRTLHLRVPVG